MVATFNVILAIVLLLFNRCQYVIERDVYMLNYFFKVDFWELI